MFNHVKSIMLITIMFEEWNYGPFGFTFKNSSFEIVKLNDHFEMIIK